MRSPAVRFILLFLIIAQLVTVTGLVAFSRQHGSRSVETQARALLETDAADIALHTANYLAPAENIVTYSTSVLSDATVDEQLLEGTFRQGLAETSQLAGVFVGSDNGDFFYVSRVGDETRVKEISHDANGRRQVELTFYSPSGELSSKSFDPTDTYDPRERPWYQQASTWGELTDWTDPYVFFTANELGITVARPIVSEGEIVGVVGADIALSQLSDFLQGLRPNDQSEAVIVDSRGSVLAFTTPELARRDGPNGSEPSTISDLESTMTHGAFEQAPEIYVESPPGTLTFDANGDEAHVAFRSIDVGSRHWTIGVIGTEEQVVGDLVNANDDQRDLQVLVGMISLLLTVAIAIPVLGPLRELESQARTDVLTRLPNRRSIMATARQLSNSSEPHAFAMIDIDRFKSINDLHGHKVGDEVLQEVARRLTSELSGSDAVGRIGGEEFIALLSGDEALTRTVAVRMWENVRQAPVDTSAGPVPVTVSVGLAFASNLTDDVQLIAEADAGLLRAKEAGRDQLITVDPALLG